MDQGPARGDHYQARVQIGRKTEQVVLAAAYPVQKHEERWLSAALGRSLCASYEVTKR
jgi:hypothetical protein